VTTFSSHIARLKSIIEFGKKMKRKIVFLGRSLGKYVYAAEKIGIVDFSSQVQIVSYKSQIAKVLKKIEREGRENYLIVATGHQGEPDAVLSKLAGGKFSFKMMPEDHVIFSCNVIPSPLNVENREALEKKLIDTNVQIYRNIHQSGHASREDHKDLINMLRPKHIIPSHVGKEKAEFMVELAEGLGYKKGKTVHIMDDGEKIEF
jgi:ribonuclease J